MFDILPQLVANSLIAGSIYALLALGFNFIYGTVKFFDLGYGSFAVVGGYGTFLFFRELGWPLALSIPLSIVIAALGGALVYWFIYRPLRRRKASNMILLVAALGVFTAIQALIAIGFTSQFQTLTTGTIGSGVFEFATAVVTKIQLTIFLSAMAIMLALVWLLKYTKFGKAVRAVSDDEEVAMIVGINTERVIWKVFAIGAAIAGLAGILIGFDTGLEPTMGLGLLLKGVIASIIGGVGNIYGGVAGAFLLGFIENFGIWQISGEWKDAIAFAVLILFLLFRPEGMFKK